MRSHRFQLLFTRFAVDVFAQQIDQAKSQLTEGRQKNELSGHESLEFMPAHFHISVCFWNQNCSTDVDQYGSQQFYAALAGKH